MMGKVPKQPTKIDVAANALIAEYRSACPVCQELDPNDAKGLRLFAQAWQPHEERCEMANVDPTETAELAVKKLRKLARQPQPERHIR